MMRFSKKIKNVDKKQAERLKHVLIQNNIFVVEIDGKKINSVDDYMKAISVAFSFPKNLFKNFESIDAYNDWMRDLSWLENFDGYAIFISHINEMLSNDIKKKEIILRNFEEVIIPFWTNEVEIVVVGGERKEFVVFYVKEGSICG